MCSKRRWHTQHRGASSSIVPVASEPSLTPVAAGGHLPPLCSAVLAEHTLCQALLNPAVRCARPSLTVTQPFTHKHTHSRSQAWDTHFTPHMQILAGSSQSYQKEEADCTDSHALKTQGLMSTQIPTLPQPISYSETPGWESSLLSHRFTYLSCASP